MKKLLSIFALLMVLVMAMPALADENVEYLQSNIQFVKDFLDARNYNYRREGDMDEIFVLDFSLEGAYPEAILYLTVYDDGVQCEAAANATAEGEGLMQLCRYIAHINSGERITTFYVDEYGELWSSNFCFSNEGRISEENFTFCYTSALTRMQAFSQDFFDILINGKTAAELIK